MLIKTTVEGTHKRLPDCHPIRSVNESHFMWLNKFGSWLDAWKQHSATVPHSFLTTETFTALSHMIKTVQIMIAGFLTNHQM